MEIIPIEYCEVSEDFVHLNQSIADCAFEHRCGDSEFSSCPLRQFFSKSGAKNYNRVAKNRLSDMPNFYFLDQ